MSGKLQTKTFSNNSDTLISPWQRHALILLSGMLAMWLHQHFRFGLDLPGRQGLMLMAILVFVRCSTPYHYSATLAGVGGFFGALIFRNNPEAAAILLVQGVALDGVYYQLKKYAVSLYLLPLAVGVIHMAKPLIKLGLTLGFATGTDSFHHGLAYPFITHFLFGSCGALIGYLAYRSLSKHN